MAPPPHSGLADVIRSLSTAQGPACLLDSVGRFLFVNDAWAHQCAPGAETPVGTSWLDRFEGDEVKRIEADLLFRALRPADGAPARAVKHVVERNTATSSVLVQIKMAPVLLEGERVAVAVIHTDVRERPIGDVYDPIDRPPEEYRDAQGAIEQCACCRRLRDARRDPDSDEGWDLVLTAVEQPPAGARQALCGMCRELHYGAPAVGPAAAPA